MVPGCRISGGVFLGRKCPTLNVARKSAVPAIAAARIGTSFGCARSTTRAEPLDVCRQFGHDRNLRRRENAAIEVKNREAISSSSR
jgi:hypothetical protein